MHYPPYVVKYFEQVRFSFLPFNAGHQIRNTDVNFGLMTKYYITETIYTYNLCGKKL